jgi:hypothetical protein
MSPTTSQNNGGNMKRYKNITDHVIITDNQSEKKSIIPAKDDSITITIRVDPVIYGRFKAFCTKAGSSKREVASEAIAYWILFLAKEAGNEGIEQARQDWKEKRL